MDKSGVHNKAQKQSEVLRGDNAGRLKRNVKCKHEHKRQQSKKTFIAQDSSLKKEKKSVST